MRQPSSRWIRLLELAAWAVTALMGALAITQAAGVTGAPIVYVVQALTPFLLTPAVPLGVVAMLANRHLLALTNVSIAGALLVLCAPVVFHADPPVIGEDATRLRVAHSNAYFESTFPADAASTLLALETDVLAITEYDADVAAALDAHGIADQYPYRVGRAPADRDGVALFSRHRIVEHSLAPIGAQYGIDAVIDVDGTMFRLLVVHPLPGVEQPAFDQWRRDLRVMAERATSPGPPTVMVGDFNGSRWHPDFRAVLERGLTDAHELLGDGFSRSWPTGTATPPFVRLDHALLGDGVTATSIHDVVVPGSDHLGFVVELATTGQ